MGYIPTAQSTGGGSIFDLSAKAYRQKLSKNEKVSFAPGNTVDLINVSGQGAVVALWVTMASPIWDSVLKVFVDGEATPSVEFEIGILGMQNATTPLSSDFKGTLHVQTNDKQIVFRYPIPYSTSIQITLTNPAASAATQDLYSQVMYLDGIDIPYRLKSAGAAWTTPATFNPSTTLTLFEDTPITEGWLVFNSMITDSAGTGMTHLESNVRVFTEGEVTASYETPGWEDLFVNSFYFGGTGNYPWGYVADLRADGVNAAIDLLALQGGIYIVDNVKVDIVASIFTTAISLGYLWLYYLKI